MRERERVGATEAWEGHNVPCTPDTQIIGSANKISTPLILTATCNKTTIGRNSCDLGSDYVDKIWRRSLPK